MGSLELPVVRWLSVRDHEESNDDVGVGGMHLQCIRKSQFRLGKSRII